ncbi:MAG TPA: cysteine desulfurase [Clostridiaceae bacterium]|nr:cysteine desulfurase [Clostridiaceae bacterium]
MIYDFDTTATSPVLPEVLDVYIRLLGELGFNPSSTHAGGLRALARLDDARRIIARYLDCSPDEIIFTSGGTESINLAILGTAASMGRRPKRALTTAGEHDAVIETMKVLRDVHGFDVGFVAITREGVVDEVALISALEEAPCGLVSFLVVSNETGAINDVRHLSSVIRQYAPQALIHGDIVQVCGKMPFSFKNSGLDFASLSGHKFGAPKGTGVLLKRRDVALSPIIHGGGQQMNIRSGTEDVPGAYALALALQSQAARLNEHVEHVAALRDRFLCEIDALRLPYSVLSPEGASPYVLSIAFPGIRGETLLNALSAEDIYISTGSACGSKRAGENHVLSAMGFDREMILSAVRISFSQQQSIDDVQYLARRIGDLYDRYAMPVRR